MAWHAPPHWKYKTKVRFIVTAACYEHNPIIGFSTSRMAELESKILDTCNSLGNNLFAWCILPNHYHILIQTDNIDAVRIELGKLHGSSSFQWNKEEGARGRKVWYRSFERPMKSNRHFWASVNYTHNNPVRHGYCEKWQEWAFSSANNFIEKFGRDKAAEIWKDYPILDYGKGWDE